MPAEIPAQALAQTVQVHGLDEVFIKARLLCFLKIRGAAIAAHRQQQHSFHRGHGAQLARHLKAVHAWQPNVQQHHIREKLCRDGQRLQARAGDACFMAAAALLSCFEIDSVGPASGTEVPEHLAFSMGPLGLRMRLRERG